MKPQKGGRYDRDTLTFTPSCLFKWGRGLFGPPASRGWPRPASPLVVAGAERPPRPQPLAGGEAGVPGCGRAVRI